MSNRITNTLTPGQSLGISLPAPESVKCIEFWNGSPYDIDYMGPGSPAQLLIPAGTGNRYFVDTVDPLTQQPRKYNPGNIQVTTNDNVNAGGSGVINILVYTYSDAIPEGTFPCAVPTQKVQAKVTSISQLVNLGNTLGTNVIQVQPSGDAGFTCTLDNSGNLVVGDATNAGSFVLAGPATLNGALTVAGTSTFNGTSKFAGVDTHTSALVLDNAIRLRTNETAGANPTDILWEDASKNLHIRQPTGIIQFENTPGTAMFILDNLNIKVPFVSDIAFADSGSTYHAVLYVDPSNNTVFRAANAVGTSLLDINATVLANFLTKAYGALSVSLLQTLDAINFNNKTFQQVSGLGGSGTATVYQFFTGSNLRIILVIENNFRNVTSTQDIAFPDKLTFTGLMFQTGINGFQLVNGGVVQSFNVITGLSAGSPGSVSSQSTFFGEGMTAIGNCDTIRFTSGNASAANGMILIIGQ